MLEAPANEPDDAVAPEAAAEDRDVEGIADVVDQCPETINGLDEDDDGCPEIVPEAHSITGA